MNEKLYFEELETVEELGWVEGVCGLALGVGGAYRSVCLHSNVELTKHRTDISKHMETNN